MPGSRGRPVFQCFAVEGTYPFFWISGVAPFLPKITCEQGRKKSLNAALVEVSSRLHGGWSADTSPGAACALTAQKSAKKVTPLTLIPPTSIIIGTSRGAKSSVRCEKKITSVRSASSCVRRHPRPLLLLALLAGSSSVLAAQPGTEKDELSAAEAGRTKAYNDYFEAAVRSKKRDPKTLNELKQKILQPAEQRHQEAVRDFNAAEIKKFRSDLNARLPQIREAEARAYREKFGKGGKGSSSASGAPSSKPDASRPAPKAGPTGTARPDFVLDGKDVQSEVEFKKRHPGKKGALPNARPEATPEPSGLPSPTGGGVDELNFPGKAKPSPTPKKPR